jgi:hypothetical protein
VAEIGASINLQINGTSKLDRLISSASQLDSIVKGLNKNPIELSTQKATNVLDRFDAELKALQASIGNSEKKINSAGDAINEYIAQIASLQTRLNQLNPNTVAYNKVLDRQQKAIRGLAQAKNDLYKAERDLESSQGKLPGAEKSVSTARTAKLATEALNGLADSYIKIKASQKGAEAGAAKRPLLESSISQINSQAEALKLVAANAKIASSEFNRFSIASQAASQELFAARQKQLSAIAFSLSESAPKVNLGQGGANAALATRNQVQDLVKLYPQIVKSEAGLSAYGDELRRIQSLVPYASEEFRKLENVLAELNQEISEIGLRGQKSAITLPRPIKALGPTSPVEGTLKQRQQYAEAVNKQYQKQLDLSDKIDRAAIGVADKEAFSLQLNQALDALGENRLEDAQKMTIEINRQVSAMSRLQKTGGTQIIGALGTGFSPISGRMPSGEIVPGSPADKGRQAKAKLSWQSALAQMSVVASELEDTAKARGAKIQMNWNLAFEKAKDIISDATLAGLQEGTKAAVSLGQQQIREMERSTAKMWREFGGPALPPGFGAGGRTGGTYRTGEFSPMGGARRLTSTLASGAIVEQSLLNLQGKGVNVADRLVQLQNALNTAKQDTFEISIKSLDALSDEVALAGKYAQLQRQILAGQGTGGKRGAGKESGFRPALTSAEVKAEINKIVTDFNAVAPKAGSAGDNVVSTFAAELKQGASSAAAAATVFAESAIKAIKKALRISSPSRVMIEIVENLVSTFVTEIRQSKVTIQAAFEDAFAPKLGSVQKAKPPSPLPGSQDLIEKLASFAGRTSARPSIFRQLAQLAGPEILFGGVLPQAMQRKAFEAGKILPETRLLPLSERRLLRGSTSAPGGGLEQAIREAAIRAVSSTGAFTGPLSSGVRSQGVVASPLLAPLSQGPAATGGTGLFSVRSQPGIGAPGSAFPFQRYRMGGAQQFPIDGPIAALGGLGTRGEASKAVSESIKKYRDAVNNFWEGEDSQFSAVSKVIKSSVQLGGAKLARKLTESGPGAGLQGAIDVITGDQRLGVSSAVSNVSQRLSDSLLNSLEALGFTISDGFKDAIGRVRNAVPSVLGGIGGILPPSGFGGGRGGGGGGAAGAGGPQNIEDLQRSLGFRDLGPIARATGEQIDELTTRLTELRQRIDPTTQDFRELTQQLGILGREQERRAPGAEFLTRRFGSRGGRAVSEGLIGGAFPLLFGQGIGAAAGGGIGGALGGFAGGGLGFGLSLAGTALGTAFDAAVQGATELGVALNKTTDTFDKVKERALFSSKETERFADRMQEMGFTASASIVAQQEVIRKIGVGGVKSLKELGDSSDRLNRAWAEFNLQLQAALAGPMADLLNWVAGIVEESNKRGRREAETRDVFSGLSSEDQKAFNVEVSKRLSNVSSIPEGAAVEQIAQVRRQVAEEFAKKANIAVGIKVETVDINKQKIAQLTKQLEFVDIGRPIIDQVRQAAREQQDLDKQRADLVRSYEESIAQIRKSVEDKIFQQRRQNAQLEVDIRSKAADLELAKLKQANNEFRGIFSDTIAGQTVDRLLNAVEGVTEIQNQGAAQRASLELQIQNTVIETEKYKIDVADQVSKLNTETARRVADINEQIRRRNEDFDINRFKLEKAIAELQLKNNEIIAKQQLDTARKNLETAKQAGDAQGTAYAQSFVNIYESQLDIIKKGQQDISAISAPAQLRGVGQVGGGGVLTTGLDQATKKGISLQQSLQAVQDQIANINSVGALIGIVDPLEKQIQQTDRLFKIYSGGGGARSKDLAAEALLIEAITQKLAEQKDQTTPLARALSELLVKENDRFSIIKLLNDAATARAQEEQLQNLIDKEEELKAQIDLVRSGKTEMSLVDQARLFFAQKGVDLEDEKTQAILRQFGVLDQLSSKLKDITTQQEMQQQLFADMAGAVASTFSSAFDTAVQGTENLGEALKGLGADLLATIGKMLIMSSLAQLFGGVLGGGAGNPQGIFSMLGKAFGYGAKNGAYFDGNMAYFAKGGIVSSPTLFQFADGGIAQTGLMGEAGPEAIMPLERGSDGKLGVSAKLGSAMGRYRRSPGAAGGPAGGGATTEAAAGGTATMEPIDVRYSVERINNVEYVTADQFRAGMAQAAQQGAIQGERRAMRTLTNSAAARGRLGI